MKNETVFSKVSCALREKLPQLFGEKRSSLWILLIGIIGIALIALSAYHPAEKAGDTVTAETSARQYAKDLEERLCKMISSIDGVGAAQVMVTLENGVEYVYASEQKTNTDRSENTSSNSITSRDDSQRSVVVIDTGSGKEGLLVTEIQPSVRGVVVSCEGGGEESVAAAVRAAVTTALNITEKRVCVIRLAT